MKIVVFGIMFYYPLAGVTYQFLHYLIGLRRLGYDPYYVEDSARWVYSPLHNDLTCDASANVQVVARALEAYGFRNRWAYRAAYPGGQCFGLTESHLARLYEEADAFLNVTGAQELRDEHLRIGTRVYVESDPFATQVRVEARDDRTLAALDGHNHFFSFGENIGAEDCDVPAGRYRWQPTRQPVVLDLWSNAPAGRAQYNTITTWHNKGRGVTYRGDVYYWTKDREFKKFIDLPRRCSVELELASGLCEADRTMIGQHGWQHVDAVAISADPARYKRYIQEARAEFTVARDQYVRPKTGWFSDRSACYLASGRPVISQDTGFGKFLPTGQGLFGFQSTDDILTAIDAIEADYAANSRAAREIAAEYFAAERVLGGLMKSVGLQ